MPLDTLRPTACYVSLLMATSTQLSASHSIISDFIRIRAAAHAYGRTDGRAGDFKRGSADKQPLLRSNYQQNPNRLSPPCWTRQTSFVDVVQNSHKCPRKREGWGGGANKGLANVVLDKKCEYTLLCCAVVPRHPKKHCCVWTLPRFVRSSFWRHE